jgi:uncharacterized protein
MNRRNFLAGSVGGVVSTQMAFSASDAKGSAGSGKPAGRPIVIDAHAHFGYMGMFGQRDISFEETLAAADVAGIDKICISSIASIVLEVEEGNKAIYRLMKQYPERVIGFATIPSPYFGKRGLDELQRAVEVYGMKGIGEVETTKDYPIDIPQWIAVLEKAADLKVPVLLHSSPGPCASAAERVPEATILLAHIGTGWGVTIGEWLDAIEMAKKHPNVYLETCCSITSYGQIEMALQGVGPERIVFGTDSPLLDPSVMKAKITGAEIPPEARQRILGLNMARLLNIPSAV